MKWWMLFVAALAFAGCGRKEAEPMGLKGPISYSGKRPDCKTCQSRGIVPNTAIAKVVAKPRQGKRFDIVEIPYGQTIQLRAIHPESGSPIPGEWSANFGTISQYGTYTAPARPFADGADFLVFSSQQQVHCVFVIKLGPGRSSSPPPSAPTLTAKIAPEAWESSPIITAPQARDNATPEGAKAEAALAKERRAQQERTLQPTPIQFAPGTATTLKKEDFPAGLSGYVVQPEGQPYGMLISGLAEPPRAGAIQGRRYPEPKTKAGKEGVRLHVSPAPWVYIDPKEDRAEPIKVTVDPKLAAQAKADFGATLQPGTEVTITSRNQARLLWRIEDVYESRGGKWVFQYSVFRKQHCLVTSEVKPAWAKPMLGLKKEESEKVVCGGWDDLPF